MDLRDLKRYPITELQMKEFSLSENLPFKELNYNFLQRFDSYYRKEGMAPNSIGLHYRNMKVIFNDAINKDLVGLELYPFRKFKITLPDY